MKLTFVILAFVILSINLLFSFNKGSDTQGPILWIAGILILILGIRFRKWIGG